MRTLYFGHDDVLTQRFPALRSVADAQLVAALSPYYRLYESDNEGNFYLIFDYTPTLPPQEEARASIAPEIRAKTFAAMKFDKPEDREQELLEVHRSLWDEAMMRALGIRRELSHRHCGGLKRMPGVLKRNCLKIGDSQNDGQ